MEYRRGVKRFASIFPEAIWFCRGSQGLDLGPSDVARLGRRHVAEGAEQAACTETIEPFESGERDRLERGYGPHDGPAGLEQALIASARALSSLSPTLAIEGLRGRGTSLGTRQGALPADPDAILMRGAVFPPRTLTRFVDLVRSAAPPRRTDPNPMLDLVLLAAGLAFFGLAAGYTALCARL